MSHSKLNVRSYRLSNIDMMRGIVIIIMAIDHVRDFFIVSGAGTSLDQPDISAALYFTRWITHFCAPAFVFLAGTSVGLMSNRRSPKQIAYFIFKRGLWLIFVEIVVISTILTFAPFGDPELGGKTLVFLQILWVLGLSMMVLALTQFMGARFCLMLGIFILIGHNLLDPIWPMGNMNGGRDPFWITLHARGSLIIGPFFIMVLYPVIPWIGVILLGFGSASIFQKPASERDSFLKKTGLVFIFLFVILRFSEFYGEPNLWQTQTSGGLSTFFDFMNLTKYPPSLLFLLATLGPIFIIIAYADKWNGWFKETLVMFGRVPFAFYVAHFILIHTLSILLGMMQGFEAKQFLHIFFFYPGGYGIGLVSVYLVWGLVLVLLYPFCKWMEKLKSTRKDWWLSYL